MKKFEHIAIMSGIYTRLFSTYISASYLIAILLNLIVSKIFDISFNYISVIVVSVVITLFFLLHKKTKCGSKKNDQNF